MPIAELLFVVSLIAPPSPEWEQWAKLILSIAVPLLILSGGLFFVAWKAFRSGKEVWTTLAVEFLRTEGFDKAVRDIVSDHCLGPEFKAIVNDVRKEAEWRFRELMRADVKEHEDQEWPHGKWRHDHYNEDIARLELRLFELEKEK